MNEEVEIENAAIRNSGKERVENSNSVQKSGAEDDIVNEEVDIVGVSRRYTDHYQGQGHSIRLAAALINIHEHLI